jgi:hypothetical protein
VNSTTSAGYKSGRLYDVAQQVVKARNFRDLETIHNDPKWKQLKNFLKGVKVTVHYRGSTQENRARPIKDLVPYAGLYRFENDDGRELTVEVCSSLSQALPSDQLNPLTTQQYYQSKNVRVSAFPFIAYQCTLMRCSSSRPKPLE